MSTLRVVPESRPVHFSSKGTVFLGAPFGGLTVRKDVGLWIGCKWWGCWCWAWLSGGKSQPGAQDWRPQNVTELSLMSGPLSLWTNGHLAWWGLSGLDTWGCDQREWRFNWTSAAVIDPVTKALLLWIGSYFIWRRDPLPFTRTLFTKFIHRTQPKASKRCVQCLKMF